MVVNDQAIRTSVDRFWAGWQALDADASLAAIADRADVIVIGTDADEYWVGRDAMAEPFRAMVMSFDEESVDWERGDPLITVRGDVAWVVGRTSVTVRAGGHVVSSQVRATFILERVASDWRIVHAHFSVPPPAPLVAY
jgi:hypothetical protein